MERGQNYKKLKSIPWLSKILHLLGDIRHADVLQSNVGIRVYVEGIGLMWSLFLERSIPRGLEFWEDKFEEEN